MMHLFSYDSPSLELNFCYPFLNLGCICFPRKSSTPPVLEVVCIFPKELSFFPPKSALALCLRHKVPVTPTQTPGCPGHQEISLLWSAQSCPGPCSVCYKGPFPVLLSDSQLWVHCWLEDGRSPHPAAAATRQWDVSPLSRWVPLIPMATEFALHLGTKLLEMPFSNSDQRNKRSRSARQKEKFYFCRRVQPQTIGRT
jgi:hypothetical protein